MREFGIELLFPLAFLIGFNINEYDKDDHHFEEVEIMLGFISLYFTTITRLDGKDVDKNDFN